MHQLSPKRISQTLSLDKRYTETSSSGNKSKNIYKKIDKIIS